MRIGNAPRAMAVPAILTIGLVCGGFGHASEAGCISDGQTVYLPVYSHIYVGAKGHPFDLAISLSVRNTDPSDAITILSVTYHNSDGKLVRSYVETPKQIPPLGSVDFFVSETDTTGGLGASFLVKWKAPKAVNEPIIEGVMAGARLGQYISFTSRGKVITDRPK